MSLYRQPGRIATRTLVIAAAVALVVGLIAGFALGRGTAAEPPTLADEGRRPARAAAARDRRGLELTATEYGQAVRGGRVVAPTEYGAAQADVAARARRRSPPRAPTSSRSTARGRRRSTPRSPASTPACAQRVDPREVRRRAEAAMQTLRDTVGT